MTKRILVIDDEPNIHTIVKISLEKFAGWYVLTASSAMEGLQIAQSESLDAILLDVSMPNIDGLQCFEKLRSQPSTETIPVILLTAKVLPSDRKRFDQLGVDGVLAKPFNPMTVWQDVATLLNW
ncbi:MAG: response regulator [Thainema sp.]